MSVNPDGLYIGRITGRSSAGPGVGITYDFAGFMPQDPNVTITITGIQPNNRPWPASCPVFARPIGEPAMLSLQANMEPMYQLVVSPETPDWDPCEQ